MVATCSPFGEYATESRQVLQRVVKVYIYTQHGHVLEWVMWEVPDGVTQVVPERVLKVYTPNAVMSLSGSCGKSPMGSPPLGRVQAYAHAHRHGQEHAHAPAHGHGQAHAHGHVHAHAMQSTFLGEWIKKRAWA